MGVASSTANKFAIESGSNGQAIEPPRSFNQANEPALDQALLNDALYEDGIPEIMTAGVRRDEAQEKAHLLKTQALLKWRQRQPLSAEERAVCLEVVRQLLMSSMALMANHDAMTTLLNPAPEKGIRLSGLFAGIVVHWSSLVNGLLVHEGCDPVEQLCIEGQDLGNRVAVDVNEIRHLLSDQAPGLESSITSFNGRAFPVGNGRNFAARGRSNLWQEARPVFSSQTGPQSRPNSNAMS